MEERLMRVLKGVVCIIKRIWPRTEPGGTTRVRGSEGEREEVGWKRLMCG